MTFTIANPRTPSPLQTRLVMCFAPTAALIYPLTLLSFHASVSAFMAGSWPKIAAIAATVSLASSFVLIALMLLAALFLAEIERPSALQLRARKVAFLSVAAPTIFVFLGVLLYMAGNPVSEQVVWIVMWGTAVLSIGLGGRSYRDEIRTRANFPRLRVAHGLSASVIVFLFLGIHIYNHFLGLVGSDAHAAFMKAARLIYRAKAIEPLLVSLFLFQAASGLLLSYRSMKETMDRFRAFQFASGMYLAFYVIGHMDSVFIFARNYLGIETDWGFATGAPVGLIQDPWNIRLVPHYGLGIFFVISHLSSGLRVVLLAHGWRKAIGDRVMIGGSLAGADLATLIVLGMCGMRIRFA